MKLCRATTLAAIVWAGLAGVVHHGALAEDTIAGEATAATGAVEQGRIAWYGKKFAGRRTASGERFDPDAMTMAHPSLPFGTRVRVTNLANDKTVTLRVNDRGPTTPGRIADVSAAAARELGMIKAGVVEARLEVLD
jgi:rare lipoprotein A